MISSKAIKIIQHNILVLHKEIYESFQLSVSRSVEGGQEASWTEGVRLHQWSSSINYSYYMIFLLEIKLIKIFLLKWPCLRQANVNKAWGEASLRDGNPKAKKTHYWGKWHWRFCMKEITLQMVLLEVNTISKFNSQNSIMLLIFHGLTQEMRWP